MGTFRCANFALNWPFYLHKGCLIEQFGQLLNPKTKIPVDTIKIYPYLCPIIKENPIKPLLYAL